MDYRTSARDEYHSRLRTVIVGTEGLHVRAMDVGDNRATIGWGYTRNRDNNVEIWERSGIELSEADLDTLHHVDAEPHSLRRDARRPQAGSPCWLEGRRHVDA